MPSKLEAHEYANLFPMMTTVELEALAADVKESGLLQPIVRYGGKILDGRNRVKACEMAGVTPTFTDYDGDDAGALSLVISLNVQRRDLTAAQRAIAAARSLPAYEALADKRKKGGKTIGTHNPQGRSRTDAAKTFKVGEKSVQQAKAMLSDAPDLIEQVEACALSLAAGYEKLQTRQQQEKIQKQEADRRARDAEKNSQYREAVSNGEMTLDEALEKARAEAKEDEERQRHDASARRIWAENLLQACGLIRSYVAERSDEYLAWYTEPGAPGSDVPLTAAHVEEAIAQLNRVRTISFRTEE